MWFWACYPRVIRLSTIPGRIRGAGSGDDSRGCIIWEAWFPRAIMGVNAGTWSVSCEAFFYVHFPFMLPLARGWAERKSLPRAAFYLCLFIGFLGLADFTLSEPPFVFGYFSPLFRLPEFVLGMAIGAAVLQRRHGPPMRLHWVIVAAATVLLASCNTAYRFGLWIRANLIVVPAIGWLIYAAGCYEVSRPIALNGRCWRALQYLGQISYALFLVQLPVLLWTRGASPDSAIAILSKTSPRMTCAGFVCAILLLSVLGHEFVEKPARQFLLRRGAVRNS